MKAGFAMGDIHPAIAGELTVPLLDQWVASAASGASLIYGQGYWAEAAAGEQVAHRVMELAEAELVHPVQRRRGPGCFDYIIQRGQRGLPKGWPRIGLRPLSKFESKALDLLFDLASTGQPMLSDDRLADRLGVTLRGSATDVLARLQRAGLIAIHGSGMGRVVEVHGAGRTAPQQRGAGRAWA
jgi:hypothetical protein